jgi:FAD/FMN-containing dehydrogenase
MTKPADSTQELQHELHRALGKKGWLNDADNLRKFGTDWLGRSHSTPIGVAVPKSTREVSEVITLCRKFNVSISPQGGNTGLVGGCLQHTDRQWIVLSTIRLTGEICIDKQALTVSVSAGTILQNLHDALAEHDLSLPIHFGAEGSARIGGIVATNAGGSHAFRFGTVKDQVLGLEAVLADGSIWNGKRALIKDNTGYQLKHMFTGSEGTLGVITGVVFKVRPAPRTVVTSLLAFESLENAQRFAEHAQARLHEVLTGLEFFTELGVQLLNTHLDNIQFPFSQTHHCYVLAEAQTSLDFALNEAFEQLLEDCLEMELVADGTVALNPAHRKALWQIREEIPEGQRREGQQLKHDISVPVSRISEFIQTATAECQNLFPGVRVNAFGHLGDGNIHFNLSPPTGNTDFGDAGPILSNRIYQLAEGFDGSFAAEHGIGSIKVDLADQLRDLTERQLMRTIKMSLDPKGILNPDVIIQTRESVRQKPA